MSVASLYSMLRNAEEFVAVYGDSDWFREQYTRVREFEGVADSVEAALRSQGLWNAFCKVFYPHRLQQNLAAA